MSVHKMIPQEKIQKWLTDYLDKVVRKETTERLGQSFCNYFNITDSELFYENNDTKAIDCIIEVYEA